MTKLEGAIKEVQELQKNKLSYSTYEAQKCYFQQLLKTASMMCIEEPCQELYDTFAADDYGSKERRFHLNHCIKLVDKYTNTHAQRKDGTLYNEPTLPTIEETSVKLKNTSYPIESIDISFLIVKSELEMEYLCLKASTTGQYKHAWKDIYRYFFLHASTIYSESNILMYLDEITSSRNLGLMKEWKWKISRKAACVLIEVADTGHFQWSPIHRNFCYSDAELDDLHIQYLTSLKERNLSRSTISLYDYVFRNAFMISRINCLEKLKNLSIDKVQFIIKGFSSICNQRSLATILPILRGILEFFFEHGFTENPLSGVVMGAFVQKGNVAAYICQSDLEKLLKQLDQESRRTKAIVLLALRLGLRDCDICGLTFQDIDWKVDKICLFQKKTGEPLVLPLLFDVGNALMDYIINERPLRQDNYPYIFLRIQAPHNKLSTVYESCAKLIKASGVHPVNGTAIGVHLYRYSLVHRLLNAKVPHQVITDTLGHTSKESDKPYLSMEESMLRMCALDLSVIGKISWKEGVLND